MRPLRIVDGLVRNLKCDGLPPELEKRAGSLALIALTLLRDAVDLSVRDERTLLYNRLAADSIEVLAAADSEVTAIYLEGLVPRQRFEYWIGETEDCRDALTSGDPLADVENELSLDFIVTRPGPRMLHLMGRLSNPAQRALEVIGQVEDSTGLAVWASNARGDWGLVVWQKPDLVTVSKQGDRRIR
ncbi:MAG: hypothetical protein K0S98_2413, partial [Propionibacteriaceae bacterium]|nr:hypothetical protein [Propionibacteriaceae bacterium]